MSIELVETGDFHLDYSDVYKNGKSNFVSKNIKINAFRFRSDTIFLDISNQTTLYELYTNLKVQCYKDTYRTREPIFNFHTKGLDFIPPEQKDPSTCVIRDIFVVNKKDETLIIPNDKNITIETFKNKYPDFFLQMNDRFSIYVLDEYTLHILNNPIPKKSILIDLQESIKKYIRCSF
jgi:hypothetical protein